MGEREKAATGEKGRSPDMIGPKAILEIAKEAAKEWRADKASRLAAALSYYTILSLAPLLVILVAIAGFFVGEGDVRGRILTEAQTLFGDQGRDTVGQILDGASRPGAGLVATVIGVMMLLVGATGVFAQLQDALNTIWEVRPRPGRGVMGVVKDRLISFTVVLGIGFLLLVSLVLTAAVTAAGEFFAESLPVSAFLLQVFNFVLSFLLVTVLFALMYRVLPDADVGWADVWVGAFVTAFLFSVGKLAIGLYLGSSSVGSAYGAAGSLVVILVWVYYSAQLLLFGAEFTQVYSNRYGSRIRKEEEAEAVAEGPEEPGRQKLGRAA